MKLFLAFILLFCFSYSWSSECEEYAQEDKMNELIDMSLQELLTIQVTSASKNKEAWMNAPSSLTVFTREQIQQMGVTSVEQLLNYVPGFIATRENVFGSGYMVAARGRTTPQASYNILFLRNGQRMNSDRSGGALADNHLISLHDVKQVEIIRGPGSALYGTSAFSGVVNIITRRCANDYGEVFAGLGNLGQKETHFSLFRRAGDWEVGLSGRYFEDHGETYPNLVPGSEAIRDPQQGRDLSLSLRYQDVFLDFYHTRRQLDEFIFTNYNKIESAQNYAWYTQNYAQLQYRPWQEANKNLTLSLGVTWKESESIEGTLSTQWMREQYNQPAPLLTGNYGEEREWYAGIDGDFRLNKRHHLLVGMEFRQADNVANHALSNYVSDNLYNTLRGKVDDTTRYAGKIQAGPLLSDLLTRDIISVYLQDKIEMSPTWNATLGVRYDHYSDFGSTTNPRLALIYQPGENTRLKLLYGQAFRAPSFRQLSGFIGNSDLKAETVNTWEAVWSQQFAKGYTNITWFYSQYRDTIDTVLNHAAGDGSRQFANLPDTVMTSGLEWEGVFKPFAQTTLRATYIYLTQYEENPQRFPRYTFSLSADYHLQDWLFNFNTYYHASTEHTTLEGIRTLDGAWVANAQARYQVSPKVSFSAQVHNLFDQMYFSSVKTPFFSQGLPNRSRTYMLGVEYQF